jgi:hypothetical protein
MASTMNKAEKKKRLDAILAQQDMANFEADLNRARSVTVGTAFGGTTEVSMRMPNGSTVWCVMQPVEIIELIHQLAANVGCHINLQPRKDFSSWRDWKYTEQELARYRGEQALPGAGHAPHVNDMAPYQDKGQVLPPLKKQPGLKVEVPVRSKENVVAIKKTVDRRGNKRSTKPS